jgi:hypothetical protein
MEKTQVYLRKEELEALRRRRRGRGAASQNWSATLFARSCSSRRPRGRVAIWDGEPKRTSIDHDSVHDEP